MQRPEACDDCITLRERLVLFSNSGLSTDKIAQMHDSEINVQTFLKHGVRADSIYASNVSPQRLTGRGFTGCSTLRKVGFSAIHLCNRRFASDMASAFGSEDVIDTFLVSPSDAVLVASEECCDTLGVSLEKLLDLCAGAPLESLSVLEQTYDPTALQSVRTVTLLNTGLRAPQLKRVGYTLAHVSKTDGTGEEVAKFGF